MERVFSSTSPGTTACRSSGSRAGRCPQAQHPSIGLSSTPALPVRCIPIGAPYIAGAQLSSTLNRCNFKSSVGTSGDLHLSLWAGCGGEFQVHMVQRPRLLTSRLDWGVAPRLAVLGNRSHGPGCASSLLQAPLTSCVTLLALAALPESEARPERRDNSFLRIGPNVKSAMTKTGASPDRFSGALARKGWSPTAIEADSGRHTRSSTLLAELAETTRDAKPRRRVITRIAATQRSSCGASTPHCRAVW